jgi:hypothetical protein
VFDEIRLLEETGQSNTRIYDNVVQDFKREIKDIYDEFKIHRKGLRYDGKELTYDEFLSLFN